MIEESNKQSGKRYIILLALLLIWFKERAIVIYAKATAEAC